MNLLISGSPRRGNCESIIKRVKEKIKDSRLIFLRELNINYCKGCLSCENDGKCIIKDSMQDVYEKLLKADRLIIAVPNYYDNVPGLFKSFIDRCNIFFKNKDLKDKEVIVIVVGAGNKKANQRVIDNALYYFIRGLRMRLIKSFNIVAKEPDDLINNKDVIEIINYFS